MANSQHQYKLGGHLRAGEGLSHVPIEARALGYGLVQIMLGPQQSWMPYELTDEVAQEYRKSMYGLDTYVHMPFILNPCDRKKKGFVKATFKRFVKPARNLGTKGLVLHPGFRKEEPVEEAAKALTGFLLEVLPDLDMDLYLETDAGSKNQSAVGSLEFLEEILEKVSHERLALCIDTCHLYARGVSLWDDETRASVLGRYGSKIRLVHLNVPDPDVELGSNKDRHNVPFSTFRHKSEGIIRDLVTRYPCVLERRSLSVQEEDQKYIAQLMESGAKVTTTST